MVTHRGTVQNDVRDQVAAEPGDARRSENNPLVVLVHGDAVAVHVDETETAPGSLDSAAWRTVPQFKQPNDTKFSGERSESAATRC